MRLYLCGGGSGKKIKDAYYSFSKHLDKSKPILYIPLAMEEKKYDSCFNWFSEEIKYFNINKFEMIKSSAELSTKNFQNYSGIFIGGGNTYKLLAELKKFNNIQKLQKYLETGGNVFGGSAGAIVFGYDIDTCIIDDQNNINLKDTLGLNLLNDYSILCHYKNKNLRKNHSNLIEYSKDKKVIYLPEDAVIVIKNNNKIKMIGNSKYRIYKNGQYVAHHFANFKKDILK